MARLGDNEGEIGVVLTRTTRRSMEWSACEGQRRSRRESDTREQTQGTRSPQLTRRFLLSHVCIIRIVHCPIRLLRTQSSSALCTTLAGVAKRRGPGSVLHIPRPTSTQSVPSFPHNCKVTYPLDQDRGVCSSSLSATSTVGPNLALPWVWFARAVPSRVHDSMTVKSAFRFD